MTSKHQPADRAPWKPDAWIFYDGEEDKFPFTGRSDPRNKAGKQANEFIKRLINLPHQ